MINNNIATEIKHLQKNMVAHNNLAPSKNLAPPAPLRIQPPSVSKPPPIPRMHAIGIRSKMLSFIKSNSKIIN